MILLRFALTMALLLFMAFMFLVEMQHHWDVPSPMVFNRREYGPGRPKPEMPQDPEAWYRFRREWAEKGQYPKGWPGTVGTFLCLSWDLC